jgi:hypothetical protein
MRTLRTTQPTVTVFGSCRVHTPSMLLSKRGDIKMNQRNIFGFAHYSSEIIQQFSLITGAREIPARLRPYLNIPPNWKFPTSKDLHEFHQEFAETDLFVVEISSIRELVFKAFLLQINRTRELLFTNGNPQTEWWNHLIRSGVHSKDKFDYINATKLQVEIAEQLVVREQSLEQLTKDLRRIKSFLAKPVLFVSHFNTDYHGRPIAQRALIVNGVRSFCRSPDCQFLDPTTYVHEAGVEHSLQDLGHYKPIFEPVIAELIRNKILEMRAII